MTNKKYIIEIVEDEESLVDVLRDKLEQSGFSVISAKNGEEGLDLALESKPDLILLDIVMPKMDGITMLNKLREDEWGKDVKVILLTNLSDPEYITKALKGQAYDFLVKSDWKLDEVIEKINSVLGIKK